MILGIHQIHLYLLQLCIHQIFDIYKPNIHHILTYIHQIFTIIHVYHVTSRYLEDLYTLTYQEDSLDREEEEEEGDPEKPAAWGSSR